MKNIVSLSLFYFPYAVLSSSDPSTAPSPAPSPAPASLHGLCYKNFEELIQSTPILVEDGSSLQLSDFGINDEAITDEDSSINLFCIWFDSAINANYILDSNFALIDQIQNDHSASIQFADNQLSSTILCDDTSFQVSTTKQIETYHMCSQNCESLSCDELFIQNEEESDTSTSSDSNNIEPWMWTVGLIVFGICAIIFLIAVIIYVVTLCKNGADANKNKTKQTKTEEVIGEVLDEIAKYTIGDADDDFLFKEDWLYDPSSDSNDGQILGDKILHAVKSTNQLPNMPKVVSNNDLLNSNKTKNITINNNAKLVASASNSNLAAIIVTTNTNSHNTSNEQSINDSSSEQELELRAATLVKKSVSLDEKKKEPQKSSSCEELGKVIENNNRSGAISVEEKEPK